MNLFSDSNCHIDNYEHLCYILSMTRKKKITTREELLKINRSETARAIGVDVSIVSRLLSGERTPHITTLKRMSDYLGLTLDELYRLLIVVDKDTPV